VAENEEQIIVAEQETPNETIAPEVTAEEKKKTILERWGITAEELTELVDNNGNLRGMVFGYVAEPILKKMWFEKPPAEYLGKHDDHNRMLKGDLQVRYKGEIFDIECKSLQTKTVWKDGEVWRGQSQVDGSDKSGRIITIVDPDEAGNEPQVINVQSTLLVYEEFDILAVNIFAFFNEWKFVFAKNSDLPHSDDTQYPEEIRKRLIKSMVHVSWPPEGIFRDEPFSLIDEIIEERRRNPKKAKVVIGKVKKPKKGKKAKAEKAAPAPTLPLKDSSH